ncbi:hypothetical protein WA158_001905 [Blastocystis sp. Blastoise]
MSGECFDGINSPETPPEIGTRYIIRKELGKGAYGTVYLADDRKVGDKVAIKRIDDVFRTKTDAKRTLREIAILRQCNHVNICKLRDVLVPTNEINYRNLWIVQEFGGWDLSKIIKSARKINGWGSRHVKSIIYQMLCGLLYMQSLNIVHRDMKPSNILMSDNCNIRIIDFGLARQISQQNNRESDGRASFNEEMERSGSISIPNPSQPERQLTQHVVTRWYRAPELILLQGHYNSAIDVWSVGCIMAELLQTLEPGISRPQPLFPGSTCFPLSAKRNEKERTEKFGEEFTRQTHQLEKIFHVIGTPSKEDIEVLEDCPMKEFLLSLDPIPPRDLHDYFPNADEDAIELLKGMLAFNQNERISVRDALSSPYLSQVRKEEDEIVATNRIAFTFEFDQFFTGDEKTHLRHLIYNEAYTIHSQNTTLYGDFEPELSRPRSQTEGGKPRTRPNLPQDYNSRDTKNNGNCSIF